MIQINSTISILDDEISYVYIRASGPGGQNVNKVSSACQLRFNYAGNTSLNQEAKTRLSKMAGSKLTREGLLIIEAKRYRSQDQNRIDAETRLAKLIRKALVIPKTRLPTRPTRASLERRVDAKKRKGKIKSLRRSTGERSRF